MEPGTARKFEAGMGCVLWAFMLGMPLSIAIVMLVLGLTSTGDDASFLMFGGAAAFGIMAVVTGPAFALILSRRKRSPYVVGLLSELQRRYGGNLGLPSMLNPVAQPRLIGAIRGVALEAAVILQQRPTVASFALQAAIEREHARSNNPLFGSRLRLQVRIHLPVPFRVSMVSRTVIAGLGAGWAGMTEVRSGNPQIDERYAVYSDQPAAALAWLQQPSVWSACEGLLTINAPFITQVAFLGDSVFFGTPIAERINAETIVWIIETMYATAWSMGRR